MTARNIPLSNAIRWIGEHAAPRGTEAVEIAGLAGRVLATPWICGRDWPDADLAAIDGFAIQAADSEGAGDYNPVTLRLVGGEDVAPGTALVTFAGTPLGGHADAVTPMNPGPSARVGEIDITLPVPRGSGVDRRGSQLRAGLPAIPAERRLRPQDVALLAGSGSIEVMRQPRVQLVAPGAKTGGADALTPMLQALVARDGGVAQAVRPVAADTQSFTAALMQAAAQADLIVVAGRSGYGLDDNAAAAIEAAGGRLDVHGIAMRPGETSGLGTLGGAPLLLLPGNPLACFVAYGMLGARAVRRMAGLRAGRPPGGDVPLGRKIVSAIGLTEIVRVRVADGRATPLGSAESGGLFSLVQADGYVVVPDTSEGFAPGTVVRVYRYDDEHD